MEEQAISEGFKNLTTNQKMSVLNLLLSVARCDNEQGNQDKEIICLNVYRRILDVRGDKCIAYLESAGRQGLIKDLSQLSQSQQEFLLFVAFDIIACDGKPNETELIFTVSIFEELGLDEDRSLALIENAMMKRFAV